MLSNLLSLLETANLRRIDDIYILDKDLQTPDSLHIVANQNSTRRDMDKFIFSAF